MICKPRTRLQGCRRYGSRDDFAPGQYPHPVRDIPPETLARCKREYLARIEALCTDQGVWNDVTMYYVRACK